MWNRPVFGTESSPAAQVVKALGERLPSTWRLDVVGSRGRRGGTRPEAVVRLRAADGTRSEVLLEARRRVDPVDVRAVVDQARRLARGRAVWIVAPFLGPRTRERLTQERVGFADATGNMRLVLEKPALFIESAGADRDPRASTRALASLKGRAAGRVVRALCDYRPPYGIREIAGRSGTSLASLARVTALLEREAVVVRDEKGGIAGADPETLIRRWTQDYSLLGTNGARTYLEPRDLKALTRKLKELPGRYAVTGSLAAAARIAVPPPRLGTVYVDDPAAAAAKLGLKSVDAGANVFLVRPFDPVVYERASIVDAVNYAAASQVAADLLTSPGRGPVEGEDLLAWMTKDPDAWRG